MWYEEDLNQRQGSFRVRGNAINMELSQEKFCYENSLAVMKRIVCKRNSVMTEEETWIFRVLCDKEHP